MAWDGHELTQLTGRRITTITEDTRKTTFLFQRLSMAIQRGNAVSFHNTMVTEQIAVATIILYVSPNFPACGFLLVGFKNNNTGDNYNNKDLYSAI